MRCQSTCFFATLAIFSLVPLLLLSGEHWLPRPGAESQSWATPQPSIETVPEGPKQPPKPNREGLRSKRNHIVPVFLVPRMEVDIYDDIYDDILSSFWDIFGDSMDNLINHDQSHVWQPHPFETRFRFAKRILGGPSVPAALGNSLVSRPNFPRCTSNCPILVNWNHSKRNMVRED